MPPTLPGNRRRPPVPRVNEEVDVEYDRVALRHAILEALKGGPLSKAKIREAVHQEERRVLRELVALRKAGAVKWIGRQRLQARWALASWQEPEAPRPVFNEATAVRPKRTAPRTSWWATPNLSREEFRATAHERARETGSAYGVLPYKR